MEVSQALRVLGANRVVWIDDYFNDTPQQLTALLTQNLEAAQKCEFEELRDALDLYEYDAPKAVDQLTQTLTDLDQERRDEIKAAFFDREGQADGFAADELNNDEVALACELLNVSEDDRWTFDQAADGLTRVCEDDDTEFVYVIDLNEAGGSKTRGMDLLQSLSALQSKGTAFILTHEATASGEAALEVQLLEELHNNDSIGPPICVISKDRLRAEQGEKEIIAKGLLVGIKRAGLRRSLHEVLNAGRATLREAVDEAALMLLNIPPEQLENRVFEQGYKEGVSELHVVERAIVAHIGKRTREAFATDRAWASTRRLRSLRSIDLGTDTLVPNEHLTAFREAEVWEAEELLNRALTPIACGDVFELDYDEDVPKESKQEFILLGQPCDISLRADGKRDQDTAYLIPMKRKDITPDEGRPEDKLKVHVMPFSVNNQHLICDFRGASSVKLGVLDLASFRQDGRVRFDSKQDVPLGLLVGQEAIYQERVSAARKALDDGLDSLTGNLDFQMTLISARPFKQVHGAVIRKSEERGDKELPPRITWRLRRCGRVRMPYAASLLEKYMNMLSRRAFDLDYLE